MLKKSVVCTALCLLTFSTLASAADLRALPPPRSNIPTGGFFIGLGGSYNSIKSDQDLYAAGVSNVFSGATLVAFGQAGGPANPFHDNQSTFAPEAQAGFFGNFANSSWLWGVKLRYKYLGITSNDRLVDSPQTGSFTNTGAAPANTSFTGNVVIQASQMRVEHELALLAFLGHSFGSTNVYLGAGPALFRTKNDVLHAIGYADINGTHVSITGTPVNYSSTNWVWGTAAQIGMTYLLAPTWFLDFNYTFAVSRRYTNNYSSPFASMTDGVADTGTLFVSTSTRVTTQAFAVSINKAF
jgi:opacity protein-like surface antigen